MDVKGCSCLGYTLIIYLILFYCDTILFTYEYVPKFKELSIIGITNCVVHHIILLLLVVSHMRAMFSNPGRVTLETRVRFLKSLGHSNRRERVLHIENQNQSADTNRDIYNWTFCSECNLMKPPRAYHCQRCKCCVERMDHHCHWLNNCIGAFNQKYFLQSAFYGIILSLFTIYAVVYALLVPSSKSHMRYMHFFYVSLIALNFGLSTFGVFFNQLRTILSGRTTMEALEHTYRVPDRDAKPLQLLKNVFNSNNYLCWFLPCSRPQNSTVKIFVNNVEETIV